MHIPVLNRFTIHLYNTYMFQSSAACFNTIHAYSLNKLGIQLYSTYILKKNNIQCTLSICLPVSYVPPENTVNAFLFDGVFFLAPLAVASLRQIKYIAKCAFIKT